MCSLHVPGPQFKIIRVAYDPLPPAYSRPFQQLVNCMLRADPDDRPTTGVSRRRFEALRPPLAR